MVSFFFDAEPNSLSWRVGQEQVLPNKENITEGLERAKTQKYAFLNDMVSTPNTNRQIYPCDVFLCPETAQ